MKYLHLRERDRSGHIKPKGGVTVAYRQRDDRVEFSVAKCSSNEHFCKRIGRDVSMGRMVKGKFFGAFKVADDVKDEEIISRIINALGERVPE